MRATRLIFAAALLASLGSAAGAKTIVVFVEPMTLQRYMTVIDTPGRDRLLMCMAPPAASECKELPLKRR